MEEFALKRRERNPCEEEHQDGGSHNPSSPSATAVEKEHMFEKVVTPSDVGKLNRLVIPKQYAEKHFPLDPSTGSKGLLLSFQDESGKLWNFRYSYWNSSQSYVMTKGWSRFVKDKQLDAGDTVSFFRAIGESGGSSCRLFIDCQLRRHQPLHGIPQQAPGGHILTPFLQAAAPLAGFFTAPATANVYDKGYQICFGGGRQLGEGGGGMLPIVLDSVPVVVQAKTKRFRLFGVNMDCTTESSGEGQGTTTLELMPNANTTPFQWIPAIQVNEHRSTMDLF